MRRIRRQLTQETYEPETARCPFNLQPPFFWFTWCLESHLPDEAAPFTVLLAFQALVPSMCRKEKPQPYRGQATGEGQRC